ncbi:MAG: Uncharacterized protein XE02_0010 [Mesotoga infera]|jgi:hypothetical protein|uniref:DUF3352 domain-containing protein n=1 Tax=Mesotoga infera TaxID=1236046 RepID=A0A101H1N6_9BACT|nr:MAG: Uncharacterized protein XD86_0169 [Mesotoga infera]KUK91452.1 MAG: Uncharacterized protein XE02_0010 [Mesotoga infera]
MKRFTVFVLLIIGSLTLASVYSMADRLPAESHSILVVENLKENYDETKQTVLMDMVLNQLAIEQLIAQYVEMLAYNNGLDPKDIYKVFDGDFGLAVWVDSEGKDRLVAVFGPIENPKTLKTAIEKVLPQLLPSDMKLNIAVDQEYLYIGDIESYSLAEKGFDLTLVMADLSPGFGYFYSATGDSVQEGSIWNDEEVLIAEVLFIPQSEKSREKFSEILSGASVSGLEAGRHLPLASGSVKINNFSFLSDLDVEQMGLIPLDLEALKIGNLSISELSEDMNGEIMIDANISVDDIFASLMGTGGMTTESTDSAGYSYVVRASYRGTLDKIKSMIEEAEPNLKVLVSNDSLLVEGQYIWIQDGWLYVSSKNQTGTNEALQKGVIVSELVTYNKLLGFAGMEGFARLFVDSGYILTGLMGLEIESGVLLNSQYLEETGGVRSLIVIM